MTSALWASLITAGGVIVAIFAVYWQGLRAAGGKRDARDAKAETDTHRRIDNADTGEGDPDADRDWHRERGMRAPRQ